MADGISAQDWELLGFFECEPVLLEPNETWWGNTATYEYRSGNQRVVFSVSPAYRDFTFELHVDGRLVFIVSALSVLDIRISRFADGEAVEILYSDSQRMTLQLRPEIQVRQIHQFWDDN
ncbi:MAG: hypothetical protein JNG90_07315 [Planctomycetaceae bacterium]|nr:hypothetical protein [Planctomycetaceae bacterium]